MRILTMITGTLLAIIGVFSIANSGVYFTSLAFVIGIVLMLVGIVECVSFKKSQENDEGKHWVLIEGLTTFILGVVVITGQLAVENSILVVFGMWVMITGIRGIVIETQVTERESVRKLDYYWNMIVSVLNLILGLYTFFNPILFNASALMILGLCFLLEGANVMKIGWEMKYMKPDVIKSKDEMLEEAEKTAAKAHKEVRRAVREARKARKKIQEVEQITPVEEIINDDNTDNE